MCGRFTRFHTWPDIHRMSGLLPATETGRNTEWSSEGPPSVWQLV
jgi:hypothetical protein